MSDNFEKAFNQWMDDYVNDPKAYRDILEVAEEHLKERLEGKEPSYGDVQAATFREYLKQA